ncbi:unnamed protein product [Microthlaspi erraticum]|uniref:Uncharacterized protein n=1 Tax=Microthlaspi erraticum TaxID=1685480 RepID=A0A6D2J678_9BRAS|nr:unnamed protein product [Microthlaspi erraticum]
MRDCRNTLIVIYSSWSRRMTLTEQGLILRITQIVLVSLKSRCRLLHSPPPLSSPPNNVAATQALPLPPSTYLRPRVIPYST